MTVTWATLKAQIARTKLSDPGYSQYSEALLLDAANDALIAFAASHTGVASDFELEGDGETYAYDLPSNIIEEEGAGIYAVHWKNNEWLQRLEYWPGNVWPSSSRSTTSNPMAYVLWPYRKISFTRIPADGQDITLHYVAYYDTIVDDDSVIDIPRWALEAIKLYAAAVALEPASTKAGRLGAYRSKRDAGDPEDNPVLRLAEHYLKRYWDLLAGHEAPQYAMLQPAGR